MENELKSITKDTEKRIRKSKSFGVMPLIISEKK